MARRAILFDRDGTLIVEKCYLADPAGVILEKDVAKALVRLRDLGFVFVVVSNQSGVGRGYFDLNTVHKVNARLADLLVENGVVIGGWYVCPHAPDQRCDCRKPMPRLALRAAEDLGLDLSLSWVVGDKKSDVLLADLIGARGILITTGHGSRHAKWAIENGKPIVSDMMAVADLISANPAIATKL